MSIESVRCHQQTLMNAVSNHYHTTVTYLVHHHTCQYHLNCPTSPSNNPTVACTLSVRGSGMDVPTLKRHAPALKWMCWMHRMVTASPWMSQMSCQTRQNKPMKGQNARLWRMHLRQLKASRHVTSIVEQWGSQDKAKEPAQSIRTCWNSVRAG